MPPARRQAVAGNNTSGMPAKQHATSGKFQTRLMLVTCLLKLVCSLLFIYIYYTHRSKPRTNLYRTGFILVPDFIPDSIVPAGITGNC